MTGNYFNLLLLSVDGLTSEVLHAQVHDERRRIDDSTRICRALAFQHYTDLIVGVGKCLDAGALTETYRIILYTALVVSILLEQTGDDQAGVVLRVSVRHGVEEILLAPRGDGGVTRKADSRGSECACSEVLFEEIRLARPGR